MEEPVEYNAGKKKELVCIAKMIDYGEDKELKHFKIYSRKDAIKEMRKGFVSKYRGYFYCEPKHPNISDCLESALDALLEGK